VKQEILEELQEFASQLRALKRVVTAEKGPGINKKAIRELADSIATQWVEHLRSPLEHKFKLDPSVVAEVSASMKRLHVLTRPNNLKTSYLEVIGEVLKGFEDRLVLPIKQMATEVEAVLDLGKLVPGLADPAESNYLKEAIECAQTGHYRASIVMAWCAVIDRVRRVVEARGFDKFNASSSAMKSQTSGRWKQWTKEFKITTMPEFQQVFDSDVIAVLEHMGAIDANQGERLRWCFQVRNHSAHPGDAPIEEAHVVAFFRDICAIVLENPNFKL
jgi:hypothetical protein